MDVLGIDIGGSGIKGAIVNTETGELVTERHRIETPQPATPQVIAEVAAELARHFSWTGKIGCGFPAVVQNGIVNTAANIDKTNIGTNVESLFSETTGCEVKVLNDADAAGMAEAYFGAGKDKDGLILLLTVGTGIGSALIINGQVVPNTEFGHLRMDGCSVAELCVSDAARKREDMKWKEWGSRFNKYLIYVDKLINPDMIILGGGVSKKFEKYSDKITLETPVKPAELLNFAGIIGAAAYAGRI